MPGNEPTADELFGEEEDTDLVAALEADDGDMEGIDPNHSILSVADQKAAKAEARVAVEAERHKAALKAFLAKEKQRLKTEEGLTTGDGVKDEIVEILIDLPPFMPHMSINEASFYPGQTYKLPRHVADSLRERQARAWAHEQEINGKSFTDRYTNEAVRGMRPTNVLSGKAA